MRQRSFQCIIGAAYERNLDLRGKFPLKPLPVSDRNRYFSLPFPRLARVVALTYINLHSTHEIYE
jgi:hypothetical protein